MPNRFTIQGKGLIQGRIISKYYNYLEKRTEYTNHTIMIYFFIQKRQPCLHFSISCSSFSPLIGLTLEKKNLNVKKNHNPKE